MEQQRNDEENIDRSSDDSPQSTENVNENISEPLSINDQPPTNMEVHHHPNLHHKSKPWKEYLLEGLMIFVAVTMGFFAESLREYFGDREKEKQSIESVLRCLKSDTFKLNHIIASNNLQVKYIDSFLTLKGKDLHDPLNNHTFYFYAANGLFGDFYFKPNDAAMQQLKSSGMLRLIRKQNVIDALLQYEIDNRDMTSQQEDHYFFAKKTWANFEEVTDISIFTDTSKFILNQSNYDFQTFNYPNSDTVYITDDKNSIRMLFNNAGGMGLLTRIYILLLKGQLDHAKSVIALINKEYHLENE